MLSRLNAIAVLAGVLISGFLCAQTRVVVIPYGRFDFHADYKLDQIAEYNKIKPNEVYNAYKDSLVVALQRAKGDFQYVLPKQEDLDAIELLVSYTYKKKPIAHYAADVSGWSPQLFELFTTTYRADYVLFINWYKIRKTRYQMPSGASKAKVPYTYHFLDMDLYDKKRNWITAAAGFELKSNTPSKKAVFFKNLRLKEVRTSYINLTKDLSAWIKAQKKE